MKLLSKSVIFLFLRHAQLTMFRNSVSRASQGIDMEKEVGKGMHKVREGSVCDGAYNLLTVSLLLFCCCSMTHDKATYRRKIILESKSVSIRVGRMAAGRQADAGPRTSQGDLI